MMFLTKKKFEAEIDRRMWEREKEEYQNRRYYELEKKLFLLEDEIRRLKGEELKPVNEAVMPRTI